MKHENCHNIKRLLPEYLGSELHGEQEEQVKTHLASCRECREELLTLKKMTGASFEAEDLQPSRKLYHSLRTIVKAQRKPWYAEAMEKFSDFLLQPASLPSTASVIIVVFIFYLFSFSPSSYMPSFDSATLSFLNDSMAVHIMYFQQEDSDTLQRQNTSAVTENDSRQGIKPAHDISINPFLLQVSTQSEFGNVLNKRVYPHYVKKPKNERQRLEPSSLDLPGTQKNRYEFLYDNSKLKTFDT